MSGRAVGRSFIERFRRVGTGTSMLRAKHPPVALEVSPAEVVLVRLKKRRGKTSLDAVEMRPLSAPFAMPSLSRPQGAGREEVEEKIREAFEATGTRPGKVSLVLPDSLAKVTLVQLPEQPSSRKQLSEMVRFKLRKSVPFKLEDAAISYQLLPSEGAEAVVLVAVMLRSIVEQYEQFLVRIGARPGVVSLCTPNLFNLCRPMLTGGPAGEDAGDTAFLNCTHTYFSLLIVRGDRLIFYRCKATAGGEENASIPDGIMSRELAASFSYYQEKLAGQRIGTAYVRTASRPYEDLKALLERQGVERVLALDLSSFVTIPDGLSGDLAVGHRIAPAVGAATGAR
jgi:Tfp pilus assembly PilM family ATPase